MLSKSLLPIKSTFYAAYCFEIYEVPFFGFSKKWVKVCLIECQHVISLLETKQ